MVAECFRYYAAAPERLVGRTIPVAGGVDMTFREPMGVVGLIVPWNFPLVITSWKTAPALAAGNTVVLKPAELTPLTAIELERIALDAGLPEGVLNVVVGPGSVCGQRLVEHPDVAKIAFTGSTEVGRGHRPGRGGDDQARDARARRQVGQRRLRRRRHRGGGPRGAGRRLRQRGAGLLLALAHPGRGLGDGRASWRRWSRAVREMRVGDPLSDETEMGPLISADQRETVGSFVTEDDVAFRGSAPDGDGFWFPPTVLAPMTNDDRASREEIFGPVACVIPFARRGGGDPPRQRHDLRALGLDLDARRRPGAAGGACDRHGCPVDQLALVGAGLDAVRRLQAVGRRTRARPGRARRLHGREERLLPDGG